jgi:cytochrome c peroxidase
VVTTSRHGRVAATAIAVILAGVFSAFALARRNLVDARSLPSEAASRYFAQALGELGDALTILDGALLARDSSGLPMAYREARRSFKYAEPLLHYQFPVEVAFLNSPRMEDDDDAPQPIPRAQPVGFQVLESAIFDTAVTLDSAGRELTRMREVVRQVQSISGRGTLTAATILDAARLHLARVLTLGLAGIDSDASGDAVVEAAHSMDGLRTMLHAALSDSSPSWPAVDTTLRRAATDLRAGAGFETYNRLRFVVGFLDPAARAIAGASAGMSWPAPPRRIWRQAAATLFERDAFDSAAFAPAHALEASPALVALGQRLFHSTELSGTGTRSCATCHIPSLGLAERRARAEHLAGTTTTALRNTPTLLNVALQPTFFADGSARSLEAQIGVVLESVGEMASSPDTAAARLTRAPGWVAAFDRAIAGRTPGPIKGLEVRQVLAAFLRSLSAMNSRFDQAARGDTLALNEEERHGFTVFMGKARCGTCHFPPLFNGVTPPEYRFTESEVIGVPTSDDFARPVLDPDVGRHRVEAIELNRFGFKVPSVRNSGITEPYMHNGALKTLEQVVDFYDRGGGVGLGLRLPNQSLPSTPLQLTPAEKTALVAFMRSLTDTSGVAGHMRRTTSP